MPTWIAIDDEIDIHNVIIAMFEVWGVTGLRFTEGRAAKAWIERTDQGALHVKLPELALIDIRLPDISGIELAMQMRASATLGHIAIVLMTAYHLDDAKEQQVMRQTQADLLLYKPFPVMHELRRLLGEVITRQPFPGSPPHAATG